MMTVLEFWNDQATKDFTKSVLALASLMLVRSRPLPAWLSTAANRQRVLDEEKRRVDFWSSWITTISGVGPLTLEETRIARGELERFFSSSVRSIPALAYPGRRGSRTVPRFFRRDESVSVVDLGL
jgi:hypothetical protein